jgi:hypothetical protein
MVKTLGPLLTGGGIVLVIVGVLAWTGALSWLGKLPGDIRIITENARIYIPFTSMLLISLILNVLVWFFLWLFKHCLSGTCRIKPPAEARQTGSALARGRMPGQPSTATLGRQARLRPRDARSARERRPVETYVGQRAGAKSGAEVR